MINVKLERINQFRKDIEDGLGQKIWEEVDQASGISSANIDWERFEIIERMGSLHPLVARNEEGDIVGIVVFVVDTSMHSKDVCLAITDFIYVLPEYRNQGVAEQLIETAYTYFKTLDIDFISVTIKSWLKDFHATLENKGFKNYETVYQYNLREE